FSELPILFYLAFAVLAAWGGLMALRGDFWRADQRIVEGAFEPAKSPGVAVVVPARDEADVIGRALSSIAAQEYAGRVSVCVVDDRSADGTAEIAAGIDGVTLVAGTETPPGWTGKMWAVEQGVGAALKIDPEAEFIWLTDADIEHHPGELASLVASAESDDLDVSSRVVVLRIDTAWGCLLGRAF
ncbi:unnamed protein product, partial [Laminaria digitata]